VPRPESDIRVCFIAYLWDPRKGGGTKQYQGYFPGMRERGLRPEIFSGTPQASKIWQEDSGADWVQLAPGSALPQKVVDDVPMSGVRLPDAVGRERSSVFYRSLLEQLRKPGAQPDVLNLAAALTRDSLPWIRKLRRTGLPICYTLSLTPKFPNNWLAGTLRRRMLRQHYDLMDAIIVQSVPHEEWLRAIGYRHHIELIPNGVDTERFRPPVDEAERTRLRDRLGFAADESVIVTVGAVSPRKGTDLMIEAMRDVVLRHPRARLVVLGWRIEGSQKKAEAFRRKLSALLDDPLIAERIRLEGVVDNVEEYLRAADLYLFASDREGFPNSLLEAMASRLPTITTSFIGLGDELGKPGHHYVLAERTPAALASALNELLDDENRREALAGEGLRFMLETMRMDTTLDRFAALYRRLAKQGTRS